jgi:hypothetical protein
MNRVYGRWSTCLRLMALGSRLARQTPFVEIPIKGRDLISTKGYSQSNHGRWCTIGRPTMPDRWWRLGASGMAWAHRLHTTWLWCSVFGVFSSYGTGGVWGTHQGGLLPFGGSRAGRAVARFKPQPSAMVGECSKGRLSTRLGQTGAARNVEHRCWVDRSRGASHAAWRWKGWTYGST